MSALHQVAAENLRIWREAAYENRELRHLQLAQLANDTAAALHAGEEAAAVAAALPIPSLSTDPFERMLSTDEQLALCRALLTAHPALFAQANNCILPPDAPKTARLDGALFARAMQRFAPLLPGAVPRIFSSIPEILEETAAGHADFALLPIADAAGVRFLHFYEELERLELHITHICDIPCEPEGKSICFALLSRLYTPIAATPCTPIWECCISGNEPQNLTDVLSVAAAVGMQLRRVDSRPAPYPEHSFTHYVVLDVSNADTALFEACIALFFPRVTVTERYFECNEGESL